MPELPEVEITRRTLLNHVLNHRVRCVHLHQPLVIRGPKDPTHLLSRRWITGIDRYGKQLVIRTSTSRNPTPTHPDDDPCVCVHLGMSGSLRYHRHRQTDDPHIHVTWTLTGGGHIAFRDPRRFGGLWTFPSFQALEQHRLRSLGPDALMITPHQLAAALGCTRKPIKASLMDQHLIAGLGNIYADEILFASRLHPLTPSRDLTTPEVQRLVRLTRSILHRAISKGGSTLRDYVNADGCTGRFQNHHKAYGRCGLPCSRCGSLLVATRVIGRKTVHCGSCQVR